MKHLDHLAKDKKFKKILFIPAPALLKPKKNIHLELCGSIISQQLSIRVAEVIYGRFLQLFNKKSPTPADVLAVPFEKLKSIGLSESKTNYVRNVCSFFLEHKVTDRQLMKMTNEGLIDFLTQIKGVGKWTVEMILMFGLGREDVFAADDLGIQQAMIDVYRLDNSDKKAFKENMIKISAKWSPYRTHACRYLWAWLAAIRKEKQLQLKAK